MKRTVNAYYLLLMVFVASGFAGLVYESVWAQYLKLFLGHAAYAQTMVLCIFMGGLALGAWLASRYARSIRHPLLAYAVIEVLIGLFGLAFHGVFTRIMDFHYQQLLPLTSDPLAVTAIKGVIAILLIGPQTALLGATFPLMTTGVLRALPQASGRSIAMLYFSNSIGAAIGVLASVFFFIPRSGLPGAILAAGVINILVGLAVWLMVRRGAMRETVHDFTHGEAEIPGTAAVRPRLAPWLVLAVAAFTGMASFIYEVVWIRMLSLVLGASTHSFELMLSAFITGLALGSLAIRRWVDQIEHPYRVLGYIQILMGMFALGSLWVYSESFHWMAALLQGLARTEQGYTMFLLTSHAICFAIMLPATFMAGMTLPLITNGLLRDGYGERSVGSVYAVNTLGSIVGIVLAIHMLIPLTGLKSALITGGGLDILLGVGLLALTAARPYALRVASATVASAAAVTVTSFWVVLDPHKLYSGVYRYRVATLPPTSEFLYAADGKTASISLMRAANGTRVLATNGKPDASLRPLTMDATTDEVTQILAGSIGMAFHPEARSVANIGLGSGLTTQTLLRNPRLQVIDTIEIEEKVVEATQLLRDRVDSVFSDRRSRVIIDDAKSYFAANRSRYDIIVAEPSNPWVSGVASLFTAEFYHRMQDHLTERGVFVQWLQVYEIDHEAVASVMLALGRAFPNYVVYTTNDLDLLVVAWKSGEVREPDPAVLKWPELQGDLRRSRVEGIQDLEARRIGGKAIMEPLFRSYTVPENSDYFPYLEHRASPARFQEKSAHGFRLLATAGIPLSEILESRVPGHEATHLAENKFVDRAAGTLNAVAVHRYLTGATSVEGVLLSTREHLAVLDNYCRGGKLFTQEEALVALVNISDSTTPFLSREEARKSLLPYLRESCVGRLSGAGNLTRELIIKLIERDISGMRTAGEKLLESLDEKSNRRLWGLALDSAMVGAIAGGTPAHAQTLWRRYGRRVQTGGGIPIENRLMLALAEVRTRQR